MTTHIADLDYSEASIEVTDLLAPGPAAPGTFGAEVEAPSDCGNTNNVLDSDMHRITEAILNDDLSPASVSQLTIPPSYVAATLHRDQVHMFDGMPTKARDPRQSLHIDEVPTPDVGPGEALIAVMASSVNYNTVWSSLFEPVPTFEFLHRYGQLSELTKRHDQPYHVVGSDLAGIVLRTGPGVTRWQPGDKVVAHCLSVELESPFGHNDTMLDPQQRTWGFETNFGGLAQLALVKANQLLTKPRHLTWEEAASPSLVNSTAYRQLVSTNGANMKQGDLVLIWGAAGGLGSYATQLALNGGATPICVVSNPAKAQLCRQMGAELVIDRSEKKYQFWQSDTEQNIDEMRRFGHDIRELTGGEDVDIVFEHPGRETFGASVYVARKGGTIVTCASTSGYQHQFDNRYLWMNLKRIVGTHFANYREAYEANRLVERGVIHPTLSTTFPLAQTGDAVRSVQQNAHHGKVGVLCLAPETGMGVDDAERRNKHIDRINVFATASSGTTPSGPAPVRRI